VEYIKRNKLKTYRDDKVESEVSKYLDVILNKIAIPRLKEVLEKKTDKELIPILESFEGLSERNTDAAQYIIPFLTNLTNSTDKTVAKIAKNISNNLKS